MGREVPHHYWVAMSAMGSDGRGANALFCLEGDGVPKTSPLFQHLASRAMKSGQVRGKVSRV